MSERELTVEEALTELWNAVAENGGLDIDPGTAVWDLIAAAKREGRREMQAECVKAVEGVVSGGLESFTYKQAVLAAIRGVTP